MSFNEEWKTLLLQRYAGEYPPYNGSGNLIRKSSEDIVFDLSGMGEVKAGEVSAFMAVNGYKIDFDDGKPVWLLKDKVPDLSLEE